MFTRTIFVVILMTLLSCSAPEQKQPGQSEPPKALQEKKSSYSIKEYRGKDDLVEELYNELLDKDSTLQKLEAQLDELRRTEDDSTSDFIRFDGKNKSYHTAAGNYLSRIGDTLLRERIKTILSNSLARYEISTAAHTQMLQRIADNNTELNDLHVAVQLVSTLEMMEKYRRDNRPTAAPLQGFIQQQEAAKKMAGQQIR